MNVFDMPLEIQFVSNGMFPKPALPYGFLLFALAGIRDLPLQPCLTMPAEMGFDQTPASGEIAVVRRQYPKAMEMIGQDYDSFNSEGVTLNYMTKGLP